MKIINILLSRAVTKHYHVLIIREMDHLAAVLEKLAEDDKLHKAIGVLETAASKPFSHSRDDHGGDNDASPGTLQINEVVHISSMIYSFSEYLRLSFAL